jgi:hypothetical protein
MAERIDDSAILGEIGEEEEEISDSQPATQPLESNGALVEDEANSSLEEDEDIPVSSRP